MDISKQQQQQQNQHYQPMVSSVLPENTIFSV